jgi:hypothetical protein
MGLIRVTVDSSIIMKLLCKSKDRGPCHKMTRALSVTASTASKLELVFSQIKSAIGDGQWSPTSSRRPSTKPIIGTRCEYCQCSPMSCGFKQSMSMAGILAPRQTFAEELHAHATDSIYSDIVTSYFQCGNDTPAGGMRGISVKRNLIEEDSVDNDFVQYLGY